ncbi:NOL1/NOP2/sun family-domain-containing protein [Ampelomyces quisqualis]|uniref:Nucleolar protein 2 n=1 Tax=Ampelomyces quisqualis TaxID=50730 RepID=A0A6A5QIV7_AMPQU|nr:NOL1/NOP2/sun family-domain-containing protein [Ampelomyces quisqualis]
MGQGRRMKKQGPPGPLDESLVTRKRKDAPPAAVPERTKRSRTDAREKAAAKATPPKKSAPASGAKTRINGKPAKKSVPPPPEDDDEDMSDGVGSMDALDAVNVTGLDALGSASEDDDGNDDFADSGEDIMDSDEEVQKMGMWSDEEDEADVAEKLTAANIEGLSRKLDMQRAVEEAEAAAELEEANLQTNIAGERPKVLEDDEDQDGRPISNLVPQDVQLLRTRLNDTVRVLDDFKNLAEEGRSRTEYRAQMLKDICAYYGYSEFLAEKLLNLFPAREAFAFFEANETPRPIVIRTNTLRTHRRELAQSLINRGVQLEPVGKWSKVGLQIFESQVPLGATPEYLAGHYILQAASSFLPVMALAPQEHERVLDMTAAPGGKTTHIAALMKNTGCIFANDANKDRAKGLIGNIHRLGVKNSVVCHYSALEFPRVMGGFDRVLLDAPCSGTGVIAKDASVKTNKTEADFMKLPHLQKQLILSAIDSVDHHSKTGGYIVYSTCSVTVEENEQVIQYALNKRPNVKLVETGLTFGKEGFTNIGGKIFHPSMKMTRRYYPHTYNVDGFFVAKFKKTGLTPLNAVGVNEATNNKGKNAPSSAVESEVVDKTPIREDGDDEESDFGGFDEEEDEVYMKRAQAKTLRRKGKDPKSAPPPRVNGETREKKTQQNGDAAEVDTEKKSKVSNGKKTKPAEDTLVEVETTVKTTKVQKDKVAAPVETKTEVTVTTKKGKGGNGAEAESKTRRKGGRKAGNKAQ